MLESPDPIPDNIPPPICIAIMAAMEAFGTISEILGRPKAWSRSAAEPLGAVRLKWEREAVLFLVNQFVVSVITKALLLSMGPKLLSRASEIFAGYVA